MRTLALAVVAAVVVALSLVAPPTLAAPSSQAADALPPQATIASVMAPMSVTDFQVLPTPSDGWGAAESFQISGGTEVPARVAIYATELPTPEGAAGFLQVQLQAYRTLVGSANMIGDLGPAPTDINLDADEVYFGAFQTQEGAAPRILAIVLVARYEDTVTAVDTSMVWDSPGPISEESVRRLAVITGALAALVDNQME